MVGVVISGDCIVGNVLAVVLVAECGWILRIYMLWMGPSLLPLLCIGSSEECTRPGDGTVAGLAAILSTLLMLRLSARPLLLALHTLLLRAVIKQKSGREDVE